MAKTKKKESGSSDSKDLAKAVFTWFPGHMRVAWRQLEQDLQQMDAILFLLDARIPASSQNPGLVASLSRRNIPIVFVLNKSDLAEPHVTKAWVEHLRGQGHHVVVQSQTDSQAKGLQSTLAEMRQAVFDKWIKRGVDLQPLKLRVLGLPNVGKSTLLNRLAGRGAAKTGKKAGLTRGKSPWIQVGPGVLVMDSPGILYPRLENWQQVAMLAACGCIRREVLPIDDIAERVLKGLLEKNVLQNYQGGRYATPSLVELAVALGFILKGNEPDWERAGVWLLQNCFDGKFGPLSWESP